jgi:hypothetical protein
MKHEIINKIFHNGKKENKKRIEIRGRKKGKK